MFVYHRKAPHPIQVYGAAGSDVGILKMKHAQRPDDDRMFLYDPDFNQDLEPTDTTPNTGNMTQTFRRYTYSNSQLIANNLHLKIFTNYPPYSS